MASPSVDELGVNTIRALAMDAVQAANSGHPGAPMGAAPMAHALWTRFLRHSPGNPEWPDRDRFVLSAGHASMLLYALLHLTGYDLPLAEIERFRQWESRTPGHPERHDTPGVELTTGPLGAGFAMGVGMAIAERFLAARYNRPGFPVVDHRVYGIVSDGDLMEGVASEAASLAGTLGLGRLVYLYDDNGISIEGDTDLAFREDVGARFRAYGWDVEDVPSGTDLEAIAGAIERARAEESRPSLIIVPTTIAHGSPNKAGTASAHGAPLGEEEVRLSKRALGWPEKPAFHVPEAVRAEMGSARRRGREQEAAWRGCSRSTNAGTPSSRRSSGRRSPGRSPRGGTGRSPPSSPGARRWRPAPRPGACSTRWRRRSRRSSAAPPTSPPRTTPTSRATPTRGPSSRTGATCASGCASTRWATS